MKINYFFLFDRSCATTKSTNSKNMMAKRLAHGCYVGYFWPGHKPNQGVVAGDGTDADRHGETGMERRG